MKKILVAALAATALATPALAAEVKWSGDFNNRFGYSTQADLMRNTSLSGEGYNNTYLNNYRNNTEQIIAGFPGATLPDTKKNSKDSDFFGEIKYRLTLTATDDDKKAKGVFGVEIGADKFGGTDMRFAGDDNDDIEVRWAYLDFEVPFDTASHLVVGLQPVGYNKFLWSDNAGGVKWVSKRGALGYSLGWFRDDNNSDGLGGLNRLQNDDVYGFDVTYTVENGPKVNAFALYREDGQESLAGASEVQDQKTWLGAAIEGQAGALFYGATAIYQMGEVKAGHTAAGAQTYFRATDGTGTDIDTGEDSLDREAYLLNAEVTYKLDKARFKAGWLYTSGDDDPTDGDAENFQNIDSYMGGFGSVVVFDGLADDNTLSTSPYIMDKGLNMPYIGVDYDLNDKATIGASYLYINTAEDLGEDKDLGNEFSVRASYKIAKGLTTGIEAGYLLGGDAWDTLASDDDGDDVFRSNANVRFQF